MPPPTIAPIHGQRLPPVWQALVHAIHGRPVFGQRGVRDPDSPCEEFDPVEGIDMLGLRITAPLDGDCWTDGHYLCGGCRHLSRNSAWRLR